MIDVDKFKVGDTVWFDNEGKADSGIVAGFRRGRFGQPLVDVIRRLARNNFVPVSDGWCAAESVYETKLDCLRAMWKDADTEKYNAMRLAMQRENLATKLADEIKAEEEKANKPKATIVKFNPCDAAGGALVKLPSCIDVPVRDRDGENPVKVRTDHFIITGATSKDGPFSGYLFLYPATASGFKLTYDNRPYNGCRCASHRAGDKLTITEIRAAVESLGFELAEE